MHPLEQTQSATVAQEKASALSRNDEKPTGFPTGVRWPDVDALYTAYEGEREIYDILAGDRLKMGIRELIDLDARSPEYILSIPHAGVLVPETYRDRFVLDEAALVEIDLYSDLCYEIASGIHLRSELAPFFIDMNRTRHGVDGDELPHHLTNAAHEYYTVHDRLMLRRQYTPAEQEEVLGYHVLYHGLLDRLIGRMRRERGYALLFDCHSMTSTGLGRAEDKGEQRADFVVGTLNGTSAHSSIIDSFMTSLRSEAGLIGLGMSVARDVPYSGGFITRNHHDPEGHVHVVQLEVAMDNYMYAPQAAAPMRYAVKPHRLRVVRRAIHAAFRAAAEAAEQISP
jgi:N-formylglutamate amidohydrolase